MDEAHDHRPLADRGGARKMSRFRLVLLLAVPLSVAAAAGHAHGSLDTTFGKAGKKTTAIGSDASAHALAIQKDGKLVAAGGTSQGLHDVFALARYEPNGSLDTTFGKGGRVTTAIGALAGAWALVSQPDGKLVAAGVTAHIAASC